MKTIKEINVETRFQVGLGDVEVSDQVFEGLCLIYDNGRIQDSEGTSSSDEKISAAFEWLTVYIKEADAFEWSYEINDMIE